MFISTLSKVILSSFSILVVYRLLTHTAAGGHLSKGVVTAVTLTPHHPNFTWTLASHVVTGSRGRPQVETLTRRTGVTSF